jgi:hypothetical protein
MKRWSQGLIYIAEGGMELSWLYAWATFSLTFVPDRLFPLPEAIGTFLLATILTFFSFGRGLRVIGVLGLQLPGFLIAASRMLYLFTDRSHSYFNQAWLLTFFSKPRDPLEWVTLCIVLFWAFCFWFGGVALARRPATYQRVCNRFDLGIAAFLCLLLLKLLLLVKGGLNLREPFADFLFLPFFIFGMTAIGLARNQTDVQKDFLSGYQGMGVIVSFTAVVFLFVSGVVLIFLPYLTLAAEMGYGAIKGVTQPLGPIIVTILRFLFMYRHKREESTAQDSGQSDIDITPSGGSHSWWIELLEKIGLWGMTGLLVLAGLVAVGFGTWFLLKWLFSRTSIDKEREGFWSLIVLWATNLWSLLRTLMDKIRGNGKGRMDAIRYYNALLGWGKRSGLPHLPNETPTEYSLRLSHRFPGVTNEARLITTAFNQQVYGSRFPDADLLSKARIALFKMCSPLHWPHRLKSWFLPAS